MRILFLTDNFPPEFNAPATRTHEHCKAWVKEGVEVTVITCFPNFPGGKVYPNYKNKWRQVEVIDGIKVIRVWSFMSANKGFFKRTLDYISYSFTSFLHGLFEPCDLIVATSPQFFTAVSGCLLGIFKRKKWVMEVRDIWPESIKAVEAVKSSWVIDVLEKLELFLYRHASKIVVVTDSFKHNLVNRGVPPEKVFVIKNGVEIELFKPQPKDKALMSSLHIPDKFIIGYIGTHGLAHGLDFIVRAIHKMNDACFHFIFIGDGAEKSNTVNLARQLKVENITFIDPVKKSEIHKYLSMLDVSLVPLRKSDTFTSVIPSKIFEAAAMNIPILLGVDGETRSIIEQYNAGIYFEPENEGDFITKLKILKDELATNNAHHLGCTRLAQDFNRKNLALEMLNVLKTN